MDILTQATLGAAVGEAALGPKLGNRGAVWGVGLGLLPDVDVLAESLFDPVQQFLVHRSLTHSLLFMVVMTLLLSWLLYRLYRRTDISWERWAVTVGAVLSTHVLLDCLNNYGTLLFFPFSTYPVNLNTVFVVDPLYTLPLLIGVLVSLFLKRSAGKRRIVNGIGLALSSVYLIWAVFAKIHATEQITDAMEQQQIPRNRVMTTPTPFNTLLWAGFADHQDTLFVGLYSLLDSDDHIRFQAVPKRSPLLRYTSHELPMQRVLWFSRGYYTVKKKDEAIYFYDLRFGRSDMWMGDSGNYVWGYRFQLGERGRQIESFNRNGGDFRLTSDFWNRYIDRILGN